MRRLLCFAAFDLLLRRAIKTDYFLVTSAGLEPATYRLGICRSILMSYEAVKPFLPSFTLLFQSNAYSYLRSG